MERPSAAHQKRPKQAKGKKQQQPLKVVYITSPMKFKTSASEFRALVQELTGKDSDIDSNLAKYSTTMTTDSVSASSSTDAVNSSGHPAGLENGAVGDPIELFDKAFENFPWFSYK